VTLFGAAAVTVMMLCYAFESRHRIWTLCFAGACLASSAYGFLAGEWPFAGAEVSYGLPAGGRFALEAIRNSKEQGALLAPVQGLIA
jgi:hypothetical protein